MTETELPLSTITDNDPTDSLWASPRAASTQKKRPLVESESTPSHSSILSPSFSRFSLSTQSAPKKWRSSLSEPSEPSSVSAADNLQHSPQSLPRHAPQLRPPTPHGQQQQQHEEDSLPPLLPEVPRIVISDMTPSELAESGARRKKQPTVRTGAERQCRHVNCPRHQAYGRVGLCGTHYQQKQREERRRGASVRSYESFSPDVSRVLASVITENRPIPLVVTLRGGCRVPFCAGDIFCRGFCRKHYMKAYRASLAAELANGATSH